MDKILEGGEFEGAASDVALNRPLQILRNIDIEAGSIGDFTLGSKESFNDNRITKNITHNYYNGESGSTRKENVDETFRHYLELFRIPSPEEDQFLITNDNSPLPGTSAWILDVVDSEALLNGVKSGYHLIRGSAGKGKTFLCIYIFGYLKQRLELFPSSGMTKSILICFHCDGQKDDRKTSVRVLRSIIYQMLQQDQRLGRHCSTYLSLNGLPDFPLERLQMLFRTMVSDSERKPIIWLLDGFDECESSCKAFFSQEIERLYAPEAPKMPAVSTIIFSRDNSGLRAAKLYDLDSTEEANSNIRNDIKRLITVRISELEHIPEVRERDKNGYTEKVLLDRSEGTFLWIGYAIKELRHSRTWVEFKTALESLPPGLNALYGRIFSRFSDRDGRLIADILALVIFSFDRFRADCFGPALEALQQVKDSHNERITPPTGITWDQFTAHGVTLLCQASLLKKNDDLVTIVHQSLAEYFVLGQKGYPTSRPSFLNTKSSVYLLRITLACLQVLSQSPFSMFKKYSSFPLLTLEDYFLVYAFGFWIPHTRWLEASNPLDNKIWDPFKEQNKELLHNLTIARLYLIKRGVRSLENLGSHESISGSRTSSTLLLINRLLAGKNIEDIASQDLPYPMNQSLEFAAYAGLEELVRYRLSRMYRLKRHHKLAEKTSSLILELQYPLRTVRLQYPLIWAVVEGHHRIVNMILDHFPKRKLTRMARDVYKRAFMIALYGDAAVANVMVARSDLLMGVSYSTLFPPAGRIYYDPTIFLPEWLRLYERGLAPNELEIFYSIAHPITNWLRVNILCQNKKSLSSTNPSETLMTDISNYVIPLWRLAYRYECMKSRGGLRAHAMEIFSLLIQGIRSENSSDILLLFSKFVRADEDLLRKLKVKNKKIKMTKWLHILYLIMAIPSPGFLIATLGTGFLLPRYWKSTKIVQLARHLIQFLLQQ